MPTVLTTINISKGFVRWTEMAKTLAHEMEEVGGRMLWAGTNPEESQVFVLMELQDVSLIKTFGEREDIAKARADAGADVASTTVISPIGGMYWP
ncbi:MAG: hypothetical protein ACJAY5_000670 [Actinomycetes bacterium]|jgi:hypothetical protein